MQNQHLNIFGKSVVFISIIENKPWETKQRSNSRMQVSTWLNYHHCLATSDLFQFWECESNYTVYYIDFTPLFVLWLKNEIVFHYWMLIYCIRLWLHWYCDVMQWNKQFISLNDITVISVTWKSRYFISIYTVLMMNTGPPAQDQLNFVLQPKTS